MYFAVTDYVTCDIINMFTKEPHSLDLLLHSTLNETQNIYCLISKYIFTNKFNFVALMFGTFWRPRSKQKGKIKGPHWEILKTGVPHKELCVQSLWGYLQYSDNGKTKDVSTHGFKGGNA